MGRYRISPVLPPDAGNRCTAGCQSLLCPLWVKSGKPQIEQILSALPPKADMCELASIVGAILIINTSISPVCHLCVCLKYLKSGGGWSFLAGINKLSALRK